MFKYHHNNNNRQEKQTEKNNGIDNRLFDFRSLEMYIEMCLQNENIT